MSGEVVTCRRTYRGYVIQTVTQDSGRKTYDVFTEDYSEIGYAEPSLAIARAVVDAEIERLDRLREGL